MNDYPFLPNLTSQTVFDAELREAPADAAVFARAIARAHEVLAEARYRGDEDVVLRALGYLGDAYRVLGRLDDAVGMLREALALAEVRGDPRARLANWLRLAEAEKYRGNREHAEVLFRRALQQAENPGFAGYEDFALQHLGKCRLEQGDAAEAVYLLERALMLRQRKGDARLIASTEAALLQARARLHDVPPPS